MTPRAQTEDTAVYGGKGIIHFHRGRHYYTVSVPELEIDHVYQPGVTSILRIKDKSGPLCWWTAEQCEAYGRLKIAEMQAASSMPIEAIPVEDVFRILGDMKGHYRDVKQAAANIGVIVHNYLHSYLAAVEAEQMEPLRPTLETLGEDVTQEMCDQANAAISAGLEWFGKHKLKPLRMEKPVWSATFGYVGTDDFIGFVDDELCVVDYKTSKNLYPEIWLQTAAYQHAYQEENPHLPIQARWGINVGKDGNLTALRRGSKLFPDDFHAFMSFYAGWAWDREHVEEKGPIEIIGALEAVRGGDWIDELQAEAITQ